MSGEPTLHPVRRKVLGWAALMASLGGYLAQVKNWGDFVKNWHVAAIWVGTALAFSYLLATGTWARRHHALLYSWRKTTMALFIVCGAILGGASGALLWWAIRRDYPPPPPSLPPTAEKNASGIANAAPTGKPSAGGAASDAPKKSLGTGQARLRTNATAEVRRRYVVLDRLRDEYILTHTGNSPGLLKHEEYPPPDWINKKLQEKGEIWRYEDRDHPFTQSEYGGLTNRELKAKADALAQRMREFEAAYKKKERELSDEQSARRAAQIRPGPLRDDEAFKKQWTEDMAAGNRLRTEMDAEYRVKYLGEASALFDEILKRLPEGQRMMTTDGTLHGDVMAPRSDALQGRLAGPDPITSGANYLEILASRLPTK